MIGILEYMRCAALGVRMTWVSEDVLLAAGRWSQRGEPGGSLFAWRQELMRARHGDGVRG